jgi:toxin YoeB
LRITWRPKARQDYEDYTPKIRNRINALIDDIERHPFTGIGKPEALKFNLSGWWSRRINKEHRLIYRVRDEGSDRVLEILQCRYHY